MRTILAAGLVLLSVAAPASAQDFKPVDVFFGFGWAFPSTNVKNDFNAGWNGTIGATYNVSETWGVQGEYTYAHMNGPDKTINVFPTPVPSATVCDPYWYVCYPALVAVDTVIVDRSENDFGINIGGGITFGHFESAKFYVEARYHYVWGKTVDNCSACVTTKTNAAYFPLTFGVRW